jgi:hypothetical protein
MHWKKKCIILNWLFCMLIVLFLFYLSYAECHVVNNVQDNVFVNVVASVQYRALADKASDAFYRLTNTREQIQSYVFDGKTATCFKL